MPKASKKPAAPVKKSTKPTGMMLSSRFFSLRNWLFGHFRGLKNVY